jgi:homoserine kinase
MALGLALELGLLDERAPMGAEALYDTHPSSVAFRLAGGVGPIWVRSPIPMGRGLGFSGAARVAGLVAGHAQRAGGDFRLHDVARDVLAQATALEGHADNAAASLLGGVVATAGGHAVRVPLAFDPAVVVWIPSFTTSTDESRGKLLAPVPRADAVFNIGRVALLVAALAAGHVGALQAATEDRIHQQARFARAPASRAALDAALAHGAWCGWLSGSGPSIAALCPQDRAEALAASLPGDGHTKLLRIDHAGAVVEGN